MRNADLFLFHRSFKLAYPYYNTLFNQMDFFFPFSSLKATFFVQKLEFWTKAMHDFQTYEPNWWDRFYHPTLIDFKIFV